MFLNITFSFTSSLGLPLKEAEARLLIIADNYVQIADIFELLLDKNFSYFFADEQAELTKAESVVLEITISREVKQIRNYYNLVKMLEGFSEIQANIFDVVSEYSYSFV